VIPANCIIRANWIRCRSWLNTTSEERKRVLRSSNSSSARIIGFFFDSVRKLCLITSCCRTYSRSAKSEIQQRRAYPVHLTLYERIKHVTACLLLSHQAKYIPVRLQSASSTQSVLSFAYQPIEENVEYID